VIGWYAASWKLVGILTFPATMLAAALYPTLSRLHDQRSAIYTDVLAGALKAVVLVGVLTAAGTYLFADIAVALVYGQAAFAPAADNLKLLAGYLLLVFVNITLGGAVMAAGLQTRWILAKLLAVSLATGLALGLVPLAQATTANGGLGCAMATVVAEVLMFIAAIRLIPADRTRLTRGLARDFARAAGAAAVMAASGLLLDSGPLGRIAVATLAYVASVGLLGAIRREDINLLRDMVRLRSPA
jgi:O-antigen/teichoic acid export membrane protein